MTIFLFLTDSVRRGPFFKMNALLTLISWCIVSTMVSKCQVNPYLMVAALVFFTKTKGTVRDRKRTVASNFPSFVGVRRLEKTENVSPFTWYRTWASQWCGARRHW